MTMIDRYGTTLGRERFRKADSDKRAPLAGWLPRGAKRQRGRASAETLAAHVRVQGTQLDPEDRRYIRRKLGMKLGKFAPSIERITMRVEDVNGPRGGADHACRVKVVLSGLPSVVFVKEDPSVMAAIDGAIAGTARAVQRALRRKRSPA